MDKRNKILLAMSDAGHESTMDVIRRYLVYNTKGRREHLNSMIADNTIEMVTVEDGARLTEDGRPVFWYANESWATKKEVHAKRMDEAIKQAQDRNAATSGQSIQTPPQQSFCNSIIDGQLCGGVLSATPVCPRCALGKHGVAQIMTCDVCGAQKAVMR